MFKYTMYRIHIIATTSNGQLFYVVNFRKPVQDIKYFTKRVTAPLNKSQRQNLIKISASQFEPTTTMMPVLKTTRGKIYF